MINRLIALGVASFGMALAGCSSSTPTALQGDLDTSSTAAVDSVSALVETTAGEYDIVINFSGGTDSQREAFDLAEVRWEEIIQGDVPDVFVPGVGQVDDLEIDATIAFIDGPGGVLGFAGPSALRDGTFIPATGQMQFDSADVAQLEAAGQFGEVILHEMGHVIGIGTVWELQDLTNCRPRRFFRRFSGFFGEAAVNAYNVIFGENTDRVPVETDGGSGTACGHWDEDILANELMTGFLNQGVPNPLSQITVSSLQDQGYEVDFSAADPFTEPGRAALEAPKLQMHSQPLPEEPIIVSVN